MEIRARDAAKNKTVNNIRSKYKYGLDTKRRNRGRRRFNFRDVFNRRETNFFSDETGEPGLLGSDRMVSGETTSKSSRGVRGTTGDTQTGTRGTVEETLNPKATEVKTPSDFDNIYEGVKEYNRLVNRYKSARMEIRARQAAKSTRLNNIRSNGKYGLDTSRNFTKRQINNIRNGFKRRGNGFFSDETGEPGLLGSDRMVSGDVSVPQSRGVHRTTGDTQTGTRGTVEETLNPKATEVKAPALIYKII